MDGACGSYGGKEKCLENFGEGTWRNRLPGGKKDVNGRIILKGILNR